MDSIELIDDTLDTDASSNDLFAEVDASAKEWARYTLQIYIDTAASDENRVVELWWTALNEADGESASADRVRNGAHRYVFTIPRTAGAYRFITPVTYLTGSYISAWLQHDSMEVAADITVDAVAVGALGA